MTTILGIKCKDGVVLASDRQITYGHLKQYTDKKIFKINENIGIAGAGLSAKFQHLLKILKVQSKLYELNNKKKITPKAIANLIALILYQSIQETLFFGNISTFIIGGLNGKKSELYTIDAVGAMLYEENYYCEGSGSELALSLLENKYKEDITVKEAIKLAIEAIIIATKRDIGSGYLPFVVTITSEGYRELSDEEIKEIMNSIK